MSGDYNTALGYQALKSNTSGSYNIANGSQALTLNTTGSYNIANGHQSLLVNTTGSSNIANGHQSLSSNTTGSSNVALGSSVLYFNTTGSNNIALGEGSLQLNATGNYNIALGSGLYLNDSGSYNIAQGPDALFSNSTGSRNIAIGAASLYSSNGSYNTAVGYGSLNSSIGTVNSAIGYNAGFQMNSGSAVTFIGSFSNALGGVDVSSSTAIGVGALLAKANTMVLGGTGGNSVDIVTGTSTPWAKFSIMNSYGSTTPLFDIATTTSSTYATSSVFRVTHEGFVGIGTSSPSSKLSVTGSGTGNIFAFASSTNSNLLALNARGVLTFGSTTNSDIYINGGATSTQTNIHQNNVAIGNEAFSYYGSGVSSAIGNIALGKQALYGSSTSAMSGDYNTALGYQALKSNTSGSYNFASGYQALMANTTGENNVGMGNNSLLFNITGSHNVGIGYQTLRANTTGTTNVAIGSSALQSNTIGSYNVAFGSALFFNSTGSDNLAIGNFSLFWNTTGSGNSGIGNRSLFSNSSGSNNIGIGYQAGYNMNKGTSTTLIGSFSDALSGANISSSTALGTGAFLTTSNTMVLGGTGANSVDIVTGTSTPWAKFSIMNSYGSTMPLFDVATTTSSAYATSSLFRVSANGNITAGGTTTIGNGTTMAGIQIGYGGLCVDNDGSCTASTTGRITSVSSATGNSDLAEIYFSSQSLETGEIVSLSGGLSVQRANTGNEENIIGVISTKPGFILGFDDVSLVAREKGYPVGLKGRVPVKLSTENGPIQKGDRIMLSSITGVGMKATENARVVGIALEDYDGSVLYTEGFLNQFNDDDKVRTKNMSHNVGEDIFTELASKSATTLHTTDGQTVHVGHALMFIELGQYYTKSVTNVLTELTATSTLQEGNGTDTLWDRIKTLAQNFVDGVLAITGLKAHKVETNELCVDGVCINGEQLRALLNSNNIESNNDSDDDDTLSQEDTPIEDVDSGETEDEDVSSQSESTSESDQYVPIDTYEEQTPKDSVSESGDDSENNTADIELDVEEDAEVEHVENSEDIESENIESISEGENEIAN
jgi:trimeric autotransporter adhesin